MRWLSLVAATLAAATAAATEKQAPALAFSIVLEGKRLDVGADNLVRESTTAKVVLKAAPWGVEDHGRAVLRVESNGDVRLRAERRWRRVATLDRDDQLIFPNGERIWFDVDAATVRSSGANRKLLPLVWTGVAAQTRRSAILLWVFFEDGIATTVAKLSSKLQH